MTNEEIRAKSQEKLQAIGIFLKQMQVEVSAEQMITKEGFIKNTVYYNDIEKYVLDEPTDQYEKSIEETTAIREQDRDASLRVRPSNVGSSEGKENGIDDRDISESRRHSYSGIKK